MTPQETVDALDRYIIGQTDAKKAVAKKAAPKREFKPVSARVSTPRSKVRNSGKTTAGFRKGPEYMRTYRQMADSTGGDEFVCNLAATTSA